MVAKKKSLARKKVVAKKPEGEKANGVQFAVDLKHSGLKRQELSGFKNKITKALAQAAVKGTTKRKGEPFVKIIHVKQIFGRKIK